MATRSLVFFVLLNFATSAYAASGLARGWGASIDWRTLEAGKAEAIANQKPIMLIIHKTWCGACKGG